jgi:hypothetical protein
VSIDTAPGRELGAETSVFCIYTCEVTVGTEDFVVLGITLRRWAFPVPSNAPKSFVNEKIRIHRTTNIRLEFITKLMRNFIYSIIILHHDPQHFSSIAVVIFRRTVVYLQYLLSSHSVCCHTVHRLRVDCALYGSIQSVTIPDTLIYNCPPENEHSDARNMLRIMM